MISEPKAVDGVSIKVNDNVYRCKWGTTGNTTITPQGDREFQEEEEEGDEGEEPSSLSLKLKERRLVHGRNKKVKHSIHRHRLVSYKILKEDKIVCNVCEIYITGLAYGCDQDCDFIIHKSCLNTPTTLTNHWSHKAHPLTLRPLPDNHETHMLVCGACKDFGEGYHYHCNTCKVDLHVACASIPQGVHSCLHRYPLTLFLEGAYIPAEKKTVNCSICQDAIILEGWLYHNKDSEFVAHLGCALTWQVMIEEEESSPPKENKVTTGATTEDRFRPGFIKFVDGDVEDQKQGEEEEGVKQEEEEEKEEENEEGKENVQEKVEELGHGGKKKPTAGKKSSPHQAITGSNPKKTPKEGEGEGEEEEVEEKIELGRGGKKKPTAGKKNPSHEAITGSNPNKAPKPRCKLVDGGVKEQREEEDEEEVKEQGIEEGEEEEGKEEGKEDEEGKEEEGGETDEEKIEVDRDGQEKPTAANKSSFHIVVTTGSNPKKTLIVTTESNPKKTHKEGDEEEEEKVEMGCGGQKKPTAVKAKMIKYFGHPHAMVLSEKGLGVRSCHICDLLIKEKHYSCSEGCSFFIDQDCFNLPRQIKHELYPGHTMELTPRNGFHCEACQKGPSTGFAYESSVSLYTLHVTCAAAPLTYPVCDSPNPLILVRDFPSIAKDTCCCSCQRQVGREEWLYFHKPSSSVAHILCIIKNQKPQEIEQLLQSRKTC